MMTKGGASGWCCLSPNHIRVRLLIFFSSFFLYLCCYFSLLRLGSSFWWAKFLPACWQIVFRRGFITMGLSLVWHHQLGSSYGGEVVKDDNNSSIQRSYVWTRRRRRTIHETVCISIVYRYIYLCWVDWQIVCLGPCFVCATSENSIRHPIRTLTFAGYFSIVYTKLLCYETVARKTESKRISHHTQ